jgi:hypothetical protein
MYIPNMPSALAYVNCKEDSYTQLYLPGMHVRFVAGLLATTTPSAMKNFGPLGWGSTL